MIGGQAAVARGQRCAVRVGQLLGVQLDRDAARSGGRKHALGLRGREADALAKGVDGIYQAGVREPRQHQLAHFADVVVRAACKLGWDCVCAEECRLHLDLALPTELARSSQLPRLSLELEAVAGLDLDAGHALGEQRFEPRARCRYQLRFGSGARGAYSRHDPAARARDRLVALAVQAPLEFRSAVARVDQVCVTVDETRRDQPARAVDHLVRAPLGG
jgi:hypothetical protein